MKTLLFILTFITASAFANDCSVSIQNVEPAFNLSGVESILLSKGYELSDSTESAFSIVTEVKDNSMLAIPIYTFTATAKLYENTVQGRFLIAEQKADKFAYPNGGSIWRATARSKQEAVKKLAQKMKNCQ